MAASMIRGRLLSQIRFSQIRHYSQQQERKTLWGKDEDRPGRIRTTNAFYILLPEVPPDTPETNTLMRTNDYPNFKQVTPDKIVLGCAKLAINFEVEFGKQCLKLEDETEKKTFEALFDPVEEHLFPLNTALKTAKQLHLMKGGDFRKAYDRVYRQIVRSKEYRWMQVPFYKAVKELNKDRENLTDYQKRIVDKYLLESRPTAMNDPEAWKEYFQYTSNIKTHQYNYINAAEACRKLYTKMITDSSPINEMPKEYLYQMAADKHNPVRGPWKITLDEEDYSVFMAYCSDRDMRYDAWWNYKNKASRHMQHLYLVNHMIIKDIRWNYKDIGKMMGYKTYAHMAVENKMAGSVENVLNMIESLKLVFKPIASEELSNLQDFAVSAGCSHKLEWWDINYWERKQKEHLYKTARNNFAEYFPLPNVLKGLFNICEKLFGITIQECNNEVTTWKDQVYFYKVFDTETNKQISAFYLDPYISPSEDELSHRTFMASGRDKSDVVGALPYSYLRIKLPQPFADQPVLLKLDQVAELFHHFGHGLQQMLTSSPYSEVAGLNGIETDALFIVPHLMRHLFHNKHILKNISSHVDSGESLSEDTIDDILRLKSHSNAMKIMYELYLCAFDMEMFINEKYWGDVMEKLWPQFLPLPLHRDDNHPCSFYEIFSQDYAASYYSYIWSRMIASDVYKAFDEVGFEDLTKLAPVGKRFRESYLEKAGILSAIDVFRKFRGRDPTQDAFIEYQTKYIQNE